MKNIYYVYEHVRLDNDQIFYVGKGKNERYQSKRNRNKHWHNIVNKAGFISKILFDNLDEELALLCEQELISKYKFLKYNLVNYTDGGQGVSGLKHSKESRHKMSNSQKKRFASESTWNKGKPWSDEIKDKLSKAHLGKDTWNKGKTGIYSIESLNKMSKAKLGVFQSYFWWTNGVTDTRSPECPGDGWVRGRVNRHGTKL